MERPEGWKVADLDRTTLERIHQLEDQLGVILIAWTDEKK